MYPHRPMPPTRVRPPAQGMARVVAVFGPPRWVGRDVAVQRRFTPDDVFVIIAPQTDDGAQRTGDDVGGRRAAASAVILALMFCLSVGAQRRCAPTDVPPPTDAPDPRSPAGAGGWRGWSWSSAHRDGLDAMLRFSDVSHRMTCSSSLRPGTGAAGVPRNAFGRRFQRAGGSSRVNHPQAQMCLVTVKVAVEME